MKLSANDFSHVFAALQAAEREQASVDRRRHCRINLHAFGVSVFDLNSARRYGALVRDISINGCGRLQSWPPSTSSQLIVTFTGKKAQREIRCEVTHVSEQAQSIYMVGCSFVQIEAAVE